MITMESINWYDAALFIVNLLIILGASRLIAKESETWKSERSRFLILIYAFFWLWSVVDIITS